MTNWDRSTPLEEEKSFPRSFPPGLHQLLVLCLSLSMSTRMCLLSVILSHRDLHLSLKHLTLANQHSSTLTHTKTKTMGEAPKTLLRVDGGGLGLTAGPVFDHSPPLIRPPRHVTEASAVQQLKKRCDMQRHGQNSAHQYLQPCVPAYHTTGDQHTEANTLCPAVSIVADEPFLAASSPKQSCLLFFFLLLFNNFAAVLDKD